MHLVAGLGLTGQSVLRYFDALGEPCLAFDTRIAFDVSGLKASHPTVKFATGVLPSQWLDKITAVVLSPGIAKSEPWVNDLVQAGIDVIGDIELFARAVKKPVIAITGSNGKSTVSTLVNNVLTEAGYAVGLGGNIGLPALDVLTQDGVEHDIYVLELSSFQLETTYSLQTISATVLNLSEDHMDRYDSFESYCQSKLTIYAQSTLAVVPYEYSVDASKKSGKSSLKWQKQPGLVSEVPKIPECTFGLHAGDARLRYAPHAEHNAQSVEWLSFNNTLIMPVADMALQGSHHQLNALATLALCSPLSLSQAVFARVFSTFTGLAHRTQIVANVNGVTWVNDSKGTNVGASVTAIESFSSQGRLILLVGGVGKSADFTDLATAVKRHVTHTFVFGRDANQISLAIERVLKRHDVNESSKTRQSVNTLQEAISQANEYAQAGDIVLFSPACASFDQFKSYVERGEKFTEWVHALNPTNDRKTQIR